MSVCVCAYVTCKCVCVCVCVCVSAPYAINNWRVMRCDMYLICYMATVVGIFNGHGLDIDMHCVN